MRKRRGKAGPERKRILMDGRKRVLEPSSRLGKEGEFRKGKEREGNEKNDKATRTKKCERSEEEGGAI